LIGGFGGESKSGLTRSQKRRVKATEREHKSPLRGGRGVSKPRKRLFPLGEGTISEYSPLEGVRGVDNTISIV
jgi:hypothetical protein